MKTGDEELSEIVPDREVPPAPKNRPLMNWKQFALEVEDGMGLWLKEEAPSHASAQAAGTRLRGLGTKPLAPPGYLEVRVKEKTVYARLSPDVIDETNRVIAMGYEGDE